MIKKIEKIKARFPHSRLWLAVMSFALIVSFLNFKSDDVAAGALVTNASVIAAIDQYVATGVTVAGLSGQSLRNLLIGVASQESGGDNTAVSGDGGCGAFQITGSTIDGCAAATGNGATCDSLRANSLMGVQCAAYDLQTKYDACGGASRNGGAGTSVNMTLNAYNGRDCVETSEYSDPVDNWIAQAGGVGVSTGTTTKQVVDLSSCASPTSTLKAMTEGMYSAMQKSGAQADQIGKEVRATATPRDFKKSYCIGNELKLMQLSSIQTMILGLIKQAIMDAITQVLDYVCAEVQSITTSALNKLCIPMPTFGRINLGLVADGADACNGTALLSLKTASDTVVLPLTSASGVQKLFNTLGSKLK